MALISAPSMAAIVGKVPWRNWGRITDLCKVAFEKGLFIYPETHLEMRQLRACYGAFSLPLLSFRASSSLPLSTMRTLGSSSAGSIQCGHWAVLW